MSKTKIEWCDLTINPVVGCSKCSPGCENCYAEKFAARLAKNPATAMKYAGVVDKNGKWTGKVSFAGIDCLKRLPLESSRRVFLGSMSDIFHESMTLDCYNNIADYIEHTWFQHTFLLLTKRPKNAKIILGQRPLPKNVWLGVTVCNQNEADEKIPILLDIPATKRFISVEPMLEPINLWRFFPNGACEIPEEVKVKHLLGIEKTAINPDYENGLHWVICGAETGTNARPMNLEWARSLRDQCVKANVPYFFKKAGNKISIPDDLMVRQFPE